MNMMDELIHMIRTKNEVIEKNIRISNLYEYWNNRERQGWSVREYFDKNNIRNIAVYGLGKLGLEFIEESGKTGINVTYGIDTNRGIKLEKLNVFHPTEKLPPTDLIVITAIYYYWEIKEIFDSTELKAVSLEDIIYSQ